MNKPNKMFLAGLVAAGVVWLAGTFQSNRLENRVMGLKEPCFIARANAEKAYKPTGASIPNAASMSGYWKGTPQCRAFSKAEIAVTSWKPWPLSAALLVLGFSAMPWLWYFLLRRIAELRAAISGKPPI